MKTISAGDSRQHVVGHLLDHQSKSTVDEIIAEIGLGRTAVNQHLMVLEREGYVSRAAAVRKAGRRPSHLYALTEAPSPSNPDGHMIDVVAASIAHEVRQPLTAIIMSAAAGFRFLDHSPPDLDRAKDAFRRIVADGHRAGAMVEDIRANFRSDPSTSVALSIREVIEGAIALKHSELERYRVLARVEADRQLPQVRGNRIQLQQVLFNLIANAIEAMAESHESRVLSVRARACGHQVVVAVEDSGPGVASCGADHVFDPLFTTKPDGMGMGLAICRAIIEAHNGRLWCAPNVPHGAVFQFTLQTVGSAAL